MTAPLRVLVYSDDVTVRRQVILALGPRQNLDLPEFEFVELASESAVFASLAAAPAALLVLDGEAVPVGGIGIATRAKQETGGCPPIVVLTSRPQDAWLAPWAGADATVAHPIDPLELAETVLGLLLAPTPA